MPIHDWTRVDSGLFHAFHQGWIVALCNALNSGGLPPDYFALPEQVVGGPIPDVLALELLPNAEEPSHGTPGLAVATVPPQTRYVKRTEADCYADKANRITVRHRHGHVVAVLEIVSPGNKASRTQLRAFIEKAAELVRQGVHLLIVDLFPPSQRDPYGMHKAIWDEFQEEEFELLPDKPLTLVSYSAGSIKTAYVEPVAVGDVLPAMPLFLEPEVYVPVPLETTYQATWDQFPAAVKGLLITSAANPRPGV